MGLVLGPDWYHFTLFGWVYVASFFNLFLLMFAHDLIDVSIILLCFLTFAQRFTIFARTCLFFLHVSERHSQAAKPKSPMLPTASALVS